MDVSTTERVCVCVDGDGDGHGDGDGVCVDGWMDGWRWCVNRVYKTMVMVYDCMCAGLKEVR